jgi:hypothetical protein
MPIDIQCVVFIICEWGQVCFAMQEECISLIAIKLACSGGKLRSVAVTKLKLDVRKAGFSENWFVHKGLLAEPGLQTYCDLVLSLNPDC